MIQTKIEIAAPPEVVREMFLDFSQIPKYHSNGHFKSLGPKIPGKPLEVGDTIVADMGGMTFEPILLKNSQSEFRWRGSLPANIFTGEHIFRFEPSGVTPGATTFHQDEDFSGLISGVIGENFIANALGFRKKTQAGFEGLNADLKRWVESGSN